MKFTCSRNELSEAITNIQRAVSTKSNTPALEGIMMKAHSNKISLSGYDLELGMTTEVNASIQVEGDIVLKAKLLVDVVRKLPEDTVQFETDERLITYINCGKAAYQLIGISASEFPELPVFDHKEKIEVNSGILKAMIKQTKFAAADSNQKPIYTGCLFDMQDNVFTMVALDGYKMALRREMIDNVSNNRFVVPGKTLGEILKLPSEDDENITIITGQRHIIFNINKYSIISRLLEGSFMDYRSTIPESGKTEVIVKTSEFIRSVERMALLNSDKLLSPLACYFDNDGIKLSCSTAMGKANDFISAEIKGEAVEIGFNHRYLLDALQNVDTDLIKIQINGSSRPFKITAVQGDSFIFIVLPMRLS